jgi:hypothetical protein
MKTLVIERPEFVKQMRREIHWIEGGFDLREAPKDILRKTIATCFAIGGGPTAIGNFLLANQLLNGSLVIVDEKVSRDLEVSSVIGSLENLAWPAECMEMRFRDDLPAIIVCPSSGHSQDGEPVIAFGASSKPDASTPEGSDGAFLTLALPLSQWQAYVNGDVGDFPMSRVLSEDLDMNQAEGLGMKYMALLAMKVIAYSSVPAHKPVPVVSREEKKKAGLHPKHQHPSVKVKPTFVIRYLPRIIREPIVLNQRGRTAVPWSSGAYPSLQLRLLYPQEGAMGLDAAYSTSRRRPSHLQNTRG